MNIPKVNGVYCVPILKSTNILIAIILFIFINICNSLYIFYNTFLYFDSLMILFFWLGTFVSNNFQKEVLHTLTFIKHELRCDNEIELGRRLDIFETRSDSNVHNDNSS